MQTIAIIELVSAVYLALLLIGQGAEIGHSKSSRYLRLCTILNLVALVVDAMAYIFMDDSTPFVFRYLICLWAFIAGGINTLGFACYSEAYIAQKAVLKPVIFRIMKIAAGIWIIVTAGLFVTGKLLVYENGVEVANYGFPMPLLIYQIAVMLYIPVVAVIYRKEIGHEAVLLLSFFLITPIIGLILASLIIDDYSYLFSAVSLFFITEFLQRKQVQEQQKELTDHEALTANSARFFALQDNFESLYDVELDSGHYEVFVKGDFYRNNVLDKLAVPADYFEELRANVDAVIYPEDRDSLYNTLTRESIRRELARNEHFDHYYRIITDKGPLWFKIRIVYKDAARKNIIIGIFNAENDIEAEQIAEQKKQLQEALDLAQAASHAKSSFLFNMSHDIRTPMNAIRGFTNIAKKNLDNRERLVDCLDKIDSSGELLLSLINSVLDMSRVESGMAKLEERPGNISDSFTKIETTMQVLAKAKDISLSFTFGTITDEHVYADFDRCNRIFVNIISNAIKYSKPNGYVNVRCEQTETKKDGRAWYRYTFADNGIGMSEEFLGHIFEEFSRERNSTTSGIQGTGLGMAVVKSFVELMGGTISVQSKQGEGSTFTIILPFRLQENSPQATPVEDASDTSDGQTETAGKIDFSGRRVLLVEDNELNREIAVELLSEEGMVVEEAEDGSVAVQKLTEKGPDYYDFVLMDIQMPIMNGYEATKAIRAMYPDAKLPIIALSANAFAEDRAASLAAGMNDHVAKPIKIRELFSSLAKFL